MAHQIVFSGHMVDTPNRPTPRYPITIEAEVANMIQAALLTEVNNHGAENLRAIAGGANGGDIQFLEACVSLSIPVEMYLAYEPERFRASSVAAGGPNWEERFDHLCRTIPISILEPETSSDLNAYQQTNIWMMNTALDSATDGMTVMVLWDGREADGSGGTGDMISRAETANAEVVHLDIKTLTGERN